MNSEEKQPAEVLTAERAGNQPGDGSVSSRDYSKIPTVTVHVPTLLYFLSYGMFIPAQQDFIYKSICTFKYSNTSQQICPHIDDNNNQFSSQEDAVQADYAIYSTFASVCLYPTAMLATIAIGTWCDRLSHRLPLAIPHIGNILISSVYLAYFYFPAINKNVNPIYLSVASLLPGLSGFTLAESVAATSYVSLTSTAHKRTTKLGVIMAVMVAGQTFGYAANAFALKNFQLAFVVQIAVNLYGIVTVFAFVPELRNWQQIKQQKNDEQESWCRYLCAPHAIIASSAKAVFQKHKLRFYRVFLLLVYGLTAAFVGPYSLQSVIYDFVTLYPISFSKFDYAVYMAVNAGLVAVGVFVVLPTLRKRWCLGFFPLSDAALGVVGLISRLVALLALAFAQFIPSTGPWIYSVANMCGGLPFVSLRSGMSKLYQPSEQGRLFAVISLVEYVCILLANLAFNALYASLVSTQQTANRTLSGIIHGYTFLFAASLQLVLTLLFTWLGSQPIHDWCFHHRQNQNHMTTAMN